ncbi:6-carboxyhexanoate--CoA ligase [Virgibacillus alimentarius]|uniref:6-carboxyhexanoate--CoA ligase n=1 Tax=Virgibacillus alimentarius TaxID=698769 RepID=A0ABS4S5U7_9BACI|nr:MULTISPECIES: 6-carboxyhexanoate--CoA ligase [Virgibacillus]MBP2256838.1 6-carboxyhexanoate--CoA ligase [Virgibacillus alimentarius]HLR69520.1 6-carboxyhexanoate--CoA ligase [Virgibacillus sp.]
MLIYTSEKYFSIRMRASKYASSEQDEKHISGGEALCTYDKIKDTVNTLLDKALSHSRGDPDFMQIQFDVLNDPIKKINPLFVSNNSVNSDKTGRELALKFLVQSGVSEKAIAKGYQHLIDQSELRGAILIDYQSGERVDNSNERGIRVSRMDWLQSDFERWAAFYNLPTNPRLKEALVLATKVNDHPLAIAELCWSDDPGYITGYVASKRLGYQRITKMKSPGDEQGCRIFFIDGTKYTNSYIHYLQKQPILISWRDK